MVDHFGTFVDVVVLFLVLRRSAGRRRDYRSRAQWFRRPQCPYDSFVVVNTESADGLKTLPRLARTERARRELRRLTRLVQWNPS